MHAKIVQIAYFYIMLWLWNTVVHNAFVLDTRADIKVAIKLS